MAEFKPISVAYLSYDGLTDPLGQSQIVPYLEGLTKLNYRFTIFSFEKPDRFEKLHNEVTEWANSSGINWIPLRYHQKPPIFSTLFDVWVLWRAFKKSHDATQFKIVHCRSYIASLIGLRAKHAFQVKFVFDMRGFWADERVEGGIWNLKNPLYRIIYHFFKRRERRFLQQADHIISLTRNARTEIESWDISTAPISVIPTCVDLHLFDPKKIKEADRYALRMSLGIKPDDYVLLYLGSWGTWYLTSEMLDFFSQLKREMPHSKFLIVSSDKIDLATYVDRDDVIITNAIRKLVPLHISVAQAAICLIKPSFSKKASSATKIGEILAMDVRVVSNEGWGDILELERAGALRFIGKDYSNKGEIDGRVFCKEIFDLRKGVLAISSIYSSLTS